VIEAFVGEAGSSRLKPFGMTSPKNLNQNHLVEIFLSHVSKARHGAPRVYVIDAKVKVKGGASLC
jgi:hypothetical protein